MKLPLVRFISAQLLLLQVGQTTALPQDKEEPSVASHEERPVTLATLDVPEAPASPETIATTPEAPSSPATVTVGTASTVVVTPPTTVTIATPSTTITVTSSSAPSSSTSTPSTLSTVPTAKNVPSDPEVAKTPQATNLAEDPSLVGVPTWECNYTKGALYNVYHLEGRNWNVTKYQVKHAAGKSDLMTGFMWFEGKDSFGAQMFEADVRSFFLFLTSLGNATRPPPFSRH